ncbi:MAG: endonuclease III [Ignavibacteria bacterium]|nr:endonuclease III [Ignavibacteria bacterium]
MKKKEKVKKVIEILEKEFPDAKIRLNHSSSFELLVATILSAQCTDERVNIVTKKLFEQYRNPSDFSKLKPEELEKIIFSTGYYKSKAKHIIESSKKILAEFNGEVPSNLSDLTKLPGVGRKTANVILSHIFNKPTIVVDTHVVKITNRLGLVATKDPKKIEFELMKIVPKDKWVNFTHLLIAHGRKFCLSRKPKCAICPINNFCEFQKNIETF